MIGSQVDSSNLTWLEIKSKKQMSAKPDFLLNCSLCFAALFEKDFGADIFPWILWNNVSIDYLRGMAPIFV